MIDEKVALLEIKLGHLAVERDRDAYLRQLVELCAQVVDADRATIYLVDHTRRELRARIAWRHPVDITLAIGSGLAGHVAATGETVNVSDAYDDPRFNPEIDRTTGYRTQNALVVPVWGRGQGRIVGVIQVLNKRVGTFERRDQMFLERIAATVGPVLEQIEAEAEGRRR